MNEPNVERAEPAKRASGPIDFKMLFALATEDQFPASIPEWASSANCSAWSCIAAAMVQEFPMRALSDDFAFIDYADQPADDRR